MTEILQAIEEIGQAEMTGKPVGDRVEQLLKQQESPADVQAILNALPPSVARSHFLPILENKDTKNRAEIAKAYANFIHEVSFSDPRKAYSVMYEALSTNPAYTAEAHVFLIKYLQTYTQVAEFGSNADTQAKAVSAIVNSLSLPLWQFDEVADLVPVRALRTSTTTEHKVAFALLQAFTNNSTFKAFKEATLDQNHDLIVKRWGLNLDVLTEKIRLLLLCKLAHVNPGEPVTYKAVAAALEVPEAEVEDYVVKAISKKLLVAKIDQVSQSITISYAHHATFGVDQWRQLKDTLEHWQLQLARLSQ